MLLTKIVNCLAKVHLKVSMFCLERQIHGMFDQIHTRVDNGFPFVTAAQMNQQTKARDLRVMLDLIDKQAPEMGKAYGEGFRYLLYRDVYERLEVYLRHIQPRIPASARLQPWCA